MDLIKDTLKKSYKKKKKPRNLRGKVHKEVVIEYETKV
jgi:hypothetical protein